MKTSHLTFLALTGLTFISPCAFGDNPIEQRKEARAYFLSEAKALVEKMTLDEKIALSNMASEEVERLGIPKHDWWNEALSGVGRNGVATQFPQSIAMASTWNPELIEEMSHFIASEARAKHHAHPDGGGRYQGMTIWSPTINLARDPRWGRNEETYGEDPWLTSRIGNAFVRGLQGYHPKYLKSAATVKHFIGNNTEYKRTSLRPYIPEQFLRDYYMIPFKSAVEEADVRSIMTAYNGINDIPCGIHDWLITDVLRGEWGFTGTVVTDVDAPKFLTEHHQVTESHAEGAAKMINAGVDVISNQWSFSPHTKEAIEQGMLSEDALDRSIIQNLSTRMALGQIIDDSDNPYTKIPMNVVGSPEHRAIARKISQQGTVLLKNEDDFMPIDTEKFENIIIAGPYGNVAQLGGYSGSPTIEPVTPLTGISTAAAKRGIEIYDMTDSSGFTDIPPANLLPPADIEGSVGLKGEYFVGTELQEAPKSTRLDEKIAFNWPKPIENIDPTIPQPTFSVRWTGYLVPNRNGEHILEAVSDDGVRVWIDDELVIKDWTSRPSRANRSQPLSFEKDKKYQIRVEYYDAGGQASIQMRWSTPPSEEYDDLDPEKTLVVYVCGFNIHMADEFKDLMDLELPDDQLEELKQYHSLYPNTVVVLNGGTIVTSEWLYQNIPTVFHAWYAGQEGGDALADLLFGDISPSGKSPLTFYASYKELPDFFDYDLSKGRTYMYNEKAINFPFGHGLSYTEFEYSDVTLDKEQVASSAPSVAVSVTVTNTGDMAADEIVQVYVKDLARDPIAHNPKKQLFGFERISLKPGESKQIEITLDKRAFSYWNVEEDAYVVEAGEFELQVGASSEDIRGTARLTVF